MTDATPVQMPQRYDLVGEYDSYIDEVANGDYVRVEDVQPLLAEIASLRDKLAQARNLADAMLNGVQDHYTSMSDVRSDLWILQDVLKA
jgi:hypothetical protein